LARFGHPPGRRLRPPNSCQEADVPDCPGTAPDLPGKCGKSKLPSQRRSRVPKGALHLGMLLSSAWCSWSFTANRGAVADHPVLCALMLGTIGHEHHNSLVLQGCLGFDNVFDGICSNDGSMAPAILATGSAGCWILPLARPDEGRTPAHATVRRGGCPAAVTHRAVRRRHTCSLRACGRCSVHTG
jgi:hypothetical protein